MKFGQKALSLEKEVEAENMSMYIFIYDFYFNINRFAHNFMITIFLSILELLSYIKTHCEITWKVFWSFIQNEGSFEVNKKMSQQVQMWCYVELSKLGAV